MSNALAIKHSKNTVVDKDDELTGVRRVSERKVLYQYTFKYEVQTHKAEGSFKTMEGEAVVYVKCLHELSMGDVDDLAKEKFIEKFYSNDRIIHSTIIKKKRIY